MAEEFHGYRKYQRVKIFFQGDSDHGTIYDIDNSEEDSLPFLVLRDSTNHTVWLREDEISPEDPEPVVFQYRIRGSVPFTTRWEWADAPLEWYSGGNFYLSSMDMIQDGATPRAFDLEVRVKPDGPEFIPGYYKYVGPNAMHTASLHHFEKIADGGADVDQFYRDYVRYDVSPAE